MAVDRRIVVCAALSVVAHVALARAMRRLPPRAAPSPARVVSIRVVAPPPAEPPPEPAPPPPEATPRPVPVEHVRARRAAAAAEPTTPKDVPPPEHPPAPSATPGTPIFGVSMESTSQAGNGPSMPIGSPGGPRAGRAGGADRDDGNDKATGATPVPAYEVSTMPLPQGRCFGKYTEEAKLAAVEGTVVLDLVVGADGRVTNVHVVSGLPHGLTDAAIAAAKACRFSPGRKGDTAVPVRVRDFKIRFLLDNAE
jgi:protein TonB